MIQPFFDHNPPSERQLQRLFACYLPLVPLPADFAARLRMRVLAEVALVLQPAGGGMTHPLRWFTGTTQRPQRLLERRTYVYTATLALLLLLTLLFFSQLPIKVENE